MCIMSLPQAHIARQLQAIIPFTNDIDVRYVRYVLESRLREITKQANGVIPGISRDAALTFLLPVPPYNEQKRIIETMLYLSPMVERFGEQYEKLELLNKQIAVQLKKSILQQAIQGHLVSQNPNDGCADDLLSQIDLEKRNLLKTGRLKKQDLSFSRIFKGDDNKYYENVDGKIVDISEEIPFDLPETWEWCRLATIVHYRIGKTPARGEASFWEPGAIPWVSISDMKDYGMVTRTKETVSEKATSLLGSITAKGTLLMSFKLTVGRTSILGIDAYHNEAIISIWPFAAQDAMKYYLFYTLPLLANLGDSKDAIKGKTLNTNSINNLLIPLPPENEQIRIVEKIKELYERL